MKHARWAPFLAVSTVRLFYFQKPDTLRQQKVEDYGKLSAATGAFTAGVISLHTAIKSHLHELEEHGKKERD